MPLQDALQRETRRFAAATMLLTRVPVSIAALPADWLPRSARYFPLVGALVGLLQAAILAGANLVLPAPLPAIISIAAAMLLTGAFHEDGLADTFDSFGGSDAEARLSIMKDSRLGTYGALALLVALGLQAGALAVLPVAVAAAALVGAHGAARFASLLVMALADHAGDSAAAKIAHAPDRPRTVELAIGAFCALVACLPLALVAPATLTCALPAGALAAALMAWRGCRGIGGHTGDVLGAVTMTFHVAFLVAATSGAAPLAR